MPYIKCTGCGTQIDLDANACPYKGNVGCHNCHCVMEVDVSYDGSGSTVKLKYPDPKQDLSGSWFHLNEVERDCLNEAAVSLGDKAYTASEFMSLRNLESLCRRCYTRLKGKQFTGGWGAILDSFTGDKDFEPYSDVLDYFRRVRNRLAHPERVSSKLDAESSYKMSLRLTAELLSSVLKPTGKPKE